MKYQIWLNMTNDPSSGYIPMMDGYRQGSHMLLAYAGVTEQLFEDHQAHLPVLGHLFTEFNINHPADYNQRSLSVGDLVVLFDDDLTVPYEVCGVGWRNVDNFNPLETNNKWFSHPHPLPSCKEWENN